MAMTEFEVVMAYTSPSGQRVPFSRAMNGQIIYDADSAGEVDVGIPTYDCATNCSSGPCDGCIVERWEQQVFR